MGVNKAVFLGVRRFFLEQVSQHGRQGVGQDLGAPDRLRHIVNYRVYHMVIGCMLTSNLRRTAGRWKEVNYIRDG